VTSFFSQSGGSHRKQVFEALSDAPYALLTKAQRVALATILFKYDSTVLHRGKELIVENSFSCAYLTTPVARDVVNQHTGLVLQVLIRNTFSSIN
jgi:phospholipase A-2-activating protein